MRKEGLEPSWVSPPDPKSGASANSATFAWLVFNHLSAIMQLHQMLASVLVPITLSCEPLHSSCFVLWREVRIPSWHLSRDP